MNTDEYKVALEADLENITTELKTIATLNQATGDWVAVPVATDLQNSDQNVEADGVEEWNERRALLVQLEIRYRNINRALQKISEGVFGICEISGDKIEEERLRANPAARTNLANIDREKELPM